MNRIVDWCLKNKSVVLLATVILIASGAYASTRLNQELTPEVELPIVTVATPVPGAGPDVVDEQVTRPIQGAVEGIEGVEGVRSTSSRGFSLVIAEFGLDADAEEAEAEVGAALDDVALPQQALEPEVARESFSERPILNASLSAEDGDLAALTGYAREEAIPAIEEVEGVARAELVGGSEGQVAVELDPERLKEKDLSAAAVIGAISGASVNAPAGTVRGEGLSVPVRVTSGPVDVEALRGLPIGGGAPPAGPPPGAAGPPEGAPVGSAAGPPGGFPGGAPTGGSPAPPPEAVAAPGGSPEPVLLGDVAEVREVDADISGISRTNGEPSLGINVFKENDANTVEVAEGVEGALADVRADLGEEQVLIVNNSAEAVEESVSGLVEKAFIGGVLAVAIIFLFLRSPRATLVTAVSLPASVLAALLFSWGYGLTLNIITLAGLTIAVGRVVDDAIVVLENSYRYLRQGHGPEEAALRGTTEVASAVTSSTLTTVAVFLPLGLVGGIVSKFFLPLSLTVTFALLASLLVALTVIPVLTSVFIRRGPVRAAKSSAAGTEEGGGRLASLYATALRWSLGHRLLVVAFALVVFVGGLAAVPFLGVSFFPQSDERLLQADVELPTGTALEETSEGLRPFEEFVLGDPGVESYGLSVGGEDAAGDPESPVRADNRAQLTVAVKEEAGIQETLERLSDEGRRLYGENFRVQVFQNGPQSGGLEVALAGGTEEELERASDLVVDELSGNEDLANVESNFSEVSPEIEVRIDDQEVAEAGLSPSQVPASLQALLAGGQGLDVGDERVSVRVPEGSVDSPTEVGELPLGPGVTVADVAEVREVASPAAITRTDGERTVTVTGTITAEDTDAVSSEVEDALAGLDLPGGVAVTVGGESEDIQEAFGNLLLSIVVALALVYLVLVLFFGSLTVPLVILLSVPLITSGSFGALLLTGTSLSVPALLGVLLLIGIVVSNAILLVDFAGSARTRHSTVDEAIVEAGRARLRPILMTALATVFALLPLALGYGGGSGFISSSLAIPMVGGLVTSTLLTLFVVPVGYSLLKGGRRGGGHDRSEKERRPDRGYKATAPAPVPAAPVVTARASAGYVPKAMEEDRNGASDATSSPCPTTRRRLGSMSAAVVAAVLAVLVFVLTQSFLKPVQEQRRLIG